MEAVAKARAARASAAQGGAPPKTTLRKEKKKEKSKFAGSGTHIKPFASPTERPAKKIRPVTPAAQPIANDQDGESTVSESVELNLTFHPLPQLYRTTADLHPDIAFEDIDISNLTFDSSFEEDKENMGTTKPQLQDYKAVVNENKKLKKQVTNLKGKLQDEKATMTETLGNQGRELQALQASNENLKSVLDSTEMLSDNAKGAIKSLSDQNTQLEKQVRVVNDRNGEFLHVEALNKRKIEELEGDKTQLEQKVQGLEKQVQDLEHRPLIDPSKSNSSDVEALTKQLEASLASLESMTTEKNNYQAALNRVRDQCRGLGMDRALTADRLKQAQAEITRLSAALRTTSDALTKARTATDTASATANTASATRSAPSSAGDTIELEGMAVDLEEKDKTIRELELVKEKLTNQVEVYKKILRDAGKHAPEEVSKAVVKRIQKWTKCTGYSETKFLTGSNHETQYVELVYDSIKGDKDMGFEDKDNVDRYLPLSEFRRIYTDTCRKALNERRQYTQTLLLRAGVGMSCTRTLILGHQVLFPYTHTQFDFLPLN